LTDEQRPHTKYQEHGSPSTKPENKKMNSVTMKRQKEYKKLDTSGGQ